MNPFISIYFHSSGIIISICTTQHFNIDIRYNTISLYKYNFRINPWNLIIKHIKITNILLEFENIMLGISHKFLVGKNSVLRQIYLKYVKLRKIFSNMLLVIWYFKLTLGPFLTLSVRNGHKLKDWVFRIQAHTRSKRR